jgi:hypothetical protein
MGLPAQMWHGLESGPQGRRVGSLDVDTDCDDQSATAERSAEKCRQPAIGREHRKCGERPQKGREQVDDNHESAPINAELPPCAKTSALSMFRLNCFLSCGDDIGHLVPVTGRHFASPMRAPFFAAASLPIACFSSPFKKSFCGPPRSSSCPGMTSKSGSCSDSGCSR